MNAKKLLAVLISSLFMISLLLLAGCGSSETAENINKANEPSTSESKRVIKHELEETEISGTPKRIVALEFSFVDALAAAGIAPVGIADDGNSDIFIDEITSVIGTYTSVGTRKQPSLEVISSLQPDLIIADLNRHKEIYEELKKIAPTLVLKSLESSYQENLDSFKVITEAINAGDVQEKRLAEHSKKINELKANVAASEQRTVLPAVVTADLFNAHASNSYTGELLELLGFKNAIQQEEAYAKLNLEQLVQVNPDILFVMAAGEKTLIDEWKNNPLWQEIGAVKNNQVFVVDRNLWSKFRGLIAGEAIADEAIAQIYGGNK